MKPQQQQHYAVFGQCAITGSTVYHVVRARSPKEAEACFRRRAAECDQTGRDGNGVFTVAELRAIAAGMSRRDKKARRK